ncbi:hypothetical protein [Aquihabitans sp. McL0605]|uniref:hypothetical protein n=1 Tax=Aquihabitans sp. McL0605 TaxID=3415671 RepID=UPI003CF95C56
MTYRQARGFDLQLHAVDPSTGDTLCGLPGRKVSDKLGGNFHPGRPKACPRCEVKVKGKPQPGRTARHRADLH